QVDDELVEVMPRKKLTEREQLVIAFEVEVEHWQRTNAQRIARGQKPISRGAVYARFKAKFNRAPPRGCVAPPDEHASDDEKREALRRLSEVAREKRIPNDWVLKKFTESYGHAPEGFQLSWT